MESLAQEQIVANVLAQSDTKAVTELGEERMACTLLVSVFHNMWANEFVWYLYLSYSPCSLIRYVSQKLPGSLLHPISAGCTVLRPLENLYAVKQVRGEEERFFGFFWRFLQVLAQGSIAFCQSPWNWMNIWEVCIASVMILNVLWMALELQLVWTGSGC